MADESPYSDELRIPVSITLTLPSNAFPSRSGSGSRQGASSATGRRPGSERHGQPEPQADAAVASPTADP